MVGGGINTVTRSSLYCTSRNNEYIPTENATTVDLINDASCILLPGSLPVDPAEKFSTEIRVTTESELQGAIGSLQTDTLIVLAPGTYRLTRSLFVRTDNVTFGFTALRLTRERSRLQSILFAFSITGSR